MGDAFSHPGCESDKISSIWAGKRKHASQGSDGAAKRPHRLGSRRRKRLN